MNPPLVYGKATRLSATGLSCITSANSAIIGIMFNGTGTGLCQLFAGVTGTVTTSGAILSGIIRAAATVAGATVNLAQYIAFPAAASGGITISVGASADPDITLFWAPVG